MKSKWWPLAAALVLAGTPRLAASQPPEPKAHERPAETAQRERPAESQPSAPSNTAFGEVTRIGAEPSGTTNEGKPDQEWWKQAWVSDWTLVLVTVVYVVVTARTLRAIRQQARIAQDAAQAARDGAEETKRAGLRVERLERPWLILRVTRSNARDMFYAARSDDPRAFPIVVNLDWELANHGRTPAWITKSSMPAIRFVRLPYEDRPPHRFEGEEFDNTPVAQSAPISGTEKRTTSREEHDAIVEGTGALVFSGAVYYRDIFGTDEQPGQIHETHFCFTCERTVLSDGLIVVSWFSIGGQTEWTKYT